MHDDGRRKEMEHSLPQSLARYKLQWQEQQLRILELLLQSINIIHPQQHNVYYLYIAVV
jgi:tRNA splicing ligase